MYLYYLVLLELMMWLGIVNECAGYRDINTRWSRIQGYGKLKDVNSLIRVLVGSEVAESFNRRENEVAETI